MTGTRFAVSAPYLWMDDQLLEHHAMIISDHRIEQIIPAASIPNDLPHESFNEHILLPGLINGHTHIAMNFFRGIADDIELISWLRNHIWPAEKALLSPEFVYDASLLACAEMIRSGTTCFNDMYFFPFETASAARLAGMRAHIGMTVMEDIPTAFASTTEEYIQKGLLFFDAHRFDPLIQATWAPQSTYTVSTKTLETIRDHANEHQLRINIHLQESKTEMNEVYKKHQAAPLHVLKQLEMVNDRLIAIHMTQVDPNDFAYLREKKAHIIHCPESNMKLASGALPVQELLNLGINVGLGTDGAASNNDLDLFSEMKTAGLLSKFITHSPESLPALQLLKMATQNNAKALGIDHLVGTLSVGKEADFIAVHLYSSETLPLLSPLSQLIYAAGRQHVTDVWIRGKRLLNHRELVTLDEKEVLSKTKKWTDKIKPFYT